MYDVIVVGSYSIDMIFTGLPRLPDLGEEVVGSHFAMIPGEAYTSAVAMHRLGLNVGWATDFGSDEFSQFALHHARQEGLDERLFFHHNRSLRRVSVAASFPSDRLFITYYDPAPAIPAVLKALPMVSAKILYVPGLYHGKFFEAGLKLIRLKKMKLVMDGNAGNEDASSNRLRLDVPSVAYAVENCDMFLPNALEACRMTGEKDLTKAIEGLSKYCPLVVVKDSARGAYACQGGQICYAPSIPVTPLDTVGAGDSFNAGFLKAWLDNKPLEQCLQWGNICGALSTLAYGGTGYQVTIKEIQERLKYYENRAN